MTIKALFKITMPLIFTQMNNAYIRTINEQTNL